MSYSRVVPRDLFNEANLLKCIGRLVLLIEDGEIDWIQYHYDGDAFSIEQNAASGALFISNIQFYTLGLDVKRELHFERPLNSRGAWPLYLETSEDAFEVFNSTGSFILDKESIK